MTQRRVLILCTGNSCRSQLAEALINRLAGEGWQAYSAGTRPAGYVHPLALQVLAELGIDGTGLTSKSAESLAHLTFDRVYTVCDSAAAACPVWLRGGEVRHLPFPDPALALGSAEERLAVFRQVRDAIQARLVQPLLREAD